MEERQVARSTLVRLKAELDDLAAETELAAARFLATDEAVVRHIRNAGEIVIGPMVYSLGPGDRLRWKPLRVEPAGWQRYVNPLPQPRSAP